MAHLTALFRPFSLAGLDDVELLSRARDGHADAFRHVFDRHAPTIHRFTSDVLKDAAAAEEATQETFVRAFSRLPSLRNDARLLPWLFGIARFVMMEQRRFALRKAEAPLDDELDELSTATNTPEQVLLFREATEELDRALWKLSPERRMLLLLRADHGLSYDDLAEALDWSLAKVKVELHRARKQLRTLLSEEAAP